MNEEALRRRFGKTAALVAEHAAAQVDQVREFLRAFLAPAGSERALDVGTGAGVLALALAPLVREVVGVDLVPELLAAARRHAPSNASFVEGDATALEFPDASFDLTASRRTFHHMPRPGLGVAELARVTRSAGRVLVNDQLAPLDPLAGLELDRFERARDPSHSRTLSDGDFRDLFEANDLALLRRQARVHQRRLDPYLDLAGCEGEERERARALAPAGADAYAVEIAWYLLEKRERQA